MIKPHDACQLMQMFLNIIPSGDGAAGVGLEGMAQHGQGAGKLLLGQDIGHAHFVASQAGGGVEAGGRCHENCLTFIREIAKAPPAESVGIIDG